MIHSRVFPLFAYLTMHDTVTVEAKVQQENININDIDLCSSVTGGKVRELSLVDTCAQLIGQR